MKVEDLFAVYRRRFDRTMERLLEESPSDLREALTALGRRNAAFWFESRQEGRRYRELLARDARLLEPFREPHRGLFGNKVDLAAVWSVLSWCVRSLEWAASKGDWRPVRDLTDAFEAVFLFLESAEWAWLRSSRETGLLETRLREPEEGLSAGELWLSAPLNALWASYLSVFNLFCNRTGNLKFASRSQDLLDSLLETFHARFWDGERDECAVWVRPDREGKVFSGRSVWVALLDPGGLLFKVRRKALMEALRTRYVTESGLLRADGVAEPVLLPVYAETLWRFHGPKGRDMASTVLLRHAAAIDPETFAAGDAEYERRMLELLMRLGG